MGMRRILRLTVYRDLRYPNLRADALSNHSMSEIAHLWCRGGFYIRPKIGHTLQ